MTNISELGEFGLIRHLTEDLEPQNAGTLKGVGDDCAVLSAAPGMRTLVTTDLLMEGVHFNLTYVPLRYLGYKAVMVNLSDVYAMNAMPRQITVSLALSKRFSVEDMDELYAGMRQACQQHQVDIVGGDTTSSLTGLAISITAIGEAPEHFGRTAVSRGFVSEITVLAHIAGFDAGDRAELLIQRQGGEPVCLAVGI